MRKKGVFLKVSIIFLIFFSSLNVSFAKENIDPKIEKSFNKLSLQLEKKYSNKKRILFLEKINSKIKHALEVKKIWESKKKILLDVVKLSNEEIFKIQSEEKIKNSSQKFLEANIISKLNRELSKIEWEFFTKEMWKKVYKISEKQEFIENNSIKRIKFSKYYKITTENYNQLKSKKWVIIVNAKWENWLLEKYNIEEKKSYSDAEKLFKNFITYNKKHFLDNNIFYSYNFSNYTFFEDRYGFYDSDLIDNKIDKNTTVLYLSENTKYNFIVKNKKVKLINSDIIYWITDKKDFLDDLINDKLHLTEDTDELFIKLKSEISWLTNSSTKKEKIKKIYDFVLNNIEYTKNLDTSDKKIFSWILSYKNKDWVCEWYAKLASYSLKFAWVPEVDVIRWDVIDAQDFPKIGHAWLKIWKLYYDPTFDDPIGQAQTREYEDYLYFWLPKDLLYANRFDYWDTPESLKSKWIEYRTKLVNKNLSELSDKYKNKKYLVLKWVDFNKKYKIEVWKTIDILDAKKILPFYSVTEKQNWEITIIMNKKEKNITKLQYFQVTDSNIEQIFKQRNYNIDWLYLFNWKKKDWTYEYRVWFDVEIK